MYNFAGNYGHVPEEKINAVYQSTSKKFNITDELPARHGCHMNWQQP